MAGKDPWKGLSDYKVMFKICNGKVPERPVVPGFLNYHWFVAIRCWSWDAEERPSMSWVHSALRISGALAASVRIDCLALWLTIEVTQMAPDADVPLNRVPDFLEGFDAHSLGSPPAPESPLCRGERVRRPLLPLSRGAHG